MELERRTRRLKMKKVLVKMKKMKMKTRRSTQNATDAYYDVETL
jgi:hypothetical protein